jgi:hypothetical protein
MDNINRLIDEVINETKTGTVNADVKLYMKINTSNSSYFHLIPTLNLENKELLYLKINEYISLNKNVISIIPSDEKGGYIKRLIALLFSDMSFNDFNNPILYVQRKIDFMKNKLLEDKNIYIPFFESELIINIKGYAKETPFCFNSMLKDNEFNYLLPTISYGISDDTCYIYAIQDYNPHKKDAFHNKISRKLYKINKGVYENETDEYKDYKEGKSPYYPENISDVSPSAVLALTLFLNEIYKKGIIKVKVIPYLPIRYENKIKVLAHRAIKEAKKNNFNEEEKRKYYLDIVREYNDIQSNITEKFIRTFYRVSHHFNNVVVTSLPMEVDDCLHITLSEFFYSDNEILNEIINISNNILSK